MWLQRPPPSPLTSTLSLFTPPLNWNYVSETHHNEVLTDKANTSWYFKLQMHNSLLVEKGTLRAASSFTVGINRHEESSFCKRQIMMFTDTQGQPCWYWRLSWYLSAVLFLTPLTRGGIKCDADLLVSTEPSVSGATHYDSLGKYRHVERTSIFMSAPVASDMMTFLFQQEIIRRRVHVSFSAFLFISHPCCCILRL